MKGCRKKRVPRWNGAIWAVKCDNVSTHPQKRAVHPWMRIVAPIYYDVLRITLKPTMPSFQGRYSGMLVSGVAPSAGAPRYVRCEARGPETLPCVRIRYDGENEKGCPMPDIVLRFDKDMLVISAPVSAALARQGVDVDRDLELMTVLEPDSIQEAMRLESMAGAQCLATSTAGITPARMAQVGMEDRAQDVARASLEVLRPLKPQHVLVEIGPCGLPLDASSKASLNENRDQYARAARLFEGEQFDAFFLNGFTTASDLLCALMGVRQVSDMPAFASVDVLADGTLASGRGTLEEACSIMGEYGASVAGFSTASGIEDACALAKRAEAACDLPILVQLSVFEHKPKQGGPTDANPYYCPDAVVDAAVRLRASGVQFLRATGAATPAYTGALAATTAGLDVAVCRTAGMPVADASVVSESPSSGDGRSEGEPQVVSATDEQMSALADALREKVAAAFSGSGEA